MKNSSTLIAFISALALHLIVGGLLLMNVDLSFPKEKDKPAIINASVVSQKLFDDLAQRKKEKALQEKKRIEQLRKEREREQRERIRAREKRKRIERERIQAAKAEALRKEREVQRIKAEKLLAAKKLRAKQEAEKAKKIADAKRKKQEAARLKAKKLAQEKRKREEAKRRKAEKIAREKAAKAAKIKAAKEKERLRQAELDKQMEAEFADEFSSAQTAKQLSEIARYKALIQNKISRNWQVEPNMKGKTCTLAIRLAPDGLVLSVNRSKGDSKLCASAKRAALKAKTLPIPRDPEIAPQFRDFDITLKPDL